MIKKNTQFRRFMFTIHNAKPDHKEKIETMFLTNFLIFALIVFQFEPTKEGIPHIQGFCILKKQLRVGQYLESANKIKIPETIKSLFQDNTMHIDFNNGTVQDAINYCMKSWNKCSLHHQPNKKKYCKCSLQDRYNYSECNLCDENCWQYRTYARCQDIKNPGPFTFAREEMIKDIEEQKLSKEEIFVKHKETILTLSLNTKNINDIYTAQKKVKYIDYPRNWKMCTFYFFGPSRVGKSYLFKLLFPKTFTKTNNSGPWFDGYKKIINHNSILFDDFRGSDLKHQNLLTLLDCGEITIQKKHGNINVNPFIIGFTANQSLRSQYNYFEDNQKIVLSNGEEKQNRKYYSATLNRIDYLIEFVKFKENNSEVCKDMCNCCLIRLIFHKGSYEKFKNLDFRIEFNSNISKEKAVEIVYNEEGIFYEQGKYYSFCNNFKSETENYILYNYEIINEYETILIKFPNARINKKDNNEPEIQIDYRKYYEELQIQKSTNKKQKLDIEDSQLENSESEYDLIENSKFLDLQIESSKQKHDEDEYQIQE
ncbi:26702_t:CDS:2, partial [Gigaspora margarita]